MLTLSLRRRCKWSHFVECRFDPIKQQFILEGDRSQVEFAIREFMEINQKMVVEEADKTEVLQRKKHKMPSSEKKKLATDDGSVRSGRSSRSSGSSRSIDPKDLPQIRKAKVAQLNTAAIAWSERVDEEPKSNVSGHVGMVVVHLMSTASFQD